jgi:ribose 5-phosphate isomerase B
MVLSARFSLPFGIRFMSQKTVAIGADHAGCDLKASLSGVLTDLGFQVIDLGTNGPESVDYPDFADAVATALSEGSAQHGVLVCGSGIGMSIGANRHHGIRAALCHDEETAKLAREHNDANVLVLGARTTDEETAKKCVRVFFSTEFDGGERHARRVAKLA